MGEMEGPADGVLGEGRIVYLDNAATTRVYPQVRAVMANAFVICAAMPTVAYSLVFAEQHNGNVRLAGWAVLVSTVISIATIPLFRELLVRIAL